MVTLYQQTETFSINKNTEAVMYILVLKQDNFNVSIQSEFQNLGIKANIINVSNLEEAMEMLKWIKFDLFFSALKLSDLQADVVKEEARLLQKAKSVFLVDVSNENNVKHSVKYGVEQVWMKENIKIRNGVQSIKPGVFKNDWSFIMGCN
jgi:hypothetical protein